MMEMLLLLSGIVTQAVATPPADDPRRECQPGESAFACEVYENVRRQIPAIDDEAVILPLDPRHVPPRLTREWLAGTWVSTRGQCFGGDFGVSYTADGQFHDYWFGGRYQLRRGRIVHQITELTEAAEPGDRVGSRFTQRVRLIGPNEILVDVAPEVQRLYRCPEGGLPVETAPVAPSR